jgi:hypothetical protein
MGKIKMKDIFLIIVSLLGAVVLLWLWRLFGVLIGLIICSILGFDLWIGGLVGFGIAILIEEWFDFDALISKKKKKS